MIYLDNAATTNKKPPSVYRAVKRAVKELSANPGRSSHKLAVRASEALYLARESVSGLFSAEPEGTVFTYNATMALNIAIKTLIPGSCRVMISDSEHNSVVRPLFALGERGVCITRFPTSGLNEGILSSLLTPDTRAIVSTLASNVTGEAIDEGLLSRFAKKHGLILILDASQAAGHRKIDLKRTPADALCIPSHKALFGIMGAGGVIFSGRERGASFLEGGSGADSASPYMPTSLPEGYEAGTVALPAITALGAGCDFVKRQTEEKIESYLKTLTDRLAERITAVKGAKLYGCGSGIVSFSLGNAASTAVAELLDRHGIAVRGGLHCAPEVHRRLGTEECGLVRASLSFFNTPSETDRFYRALKAVKEELF